MRTIQVSRFITFWPAFTVIIFAFSILTTRPAKGQVSFFVPPAYSGSGTTFQADFNGDGKPDLLSSDGTLQLGKGDGTFTSGQSVAGNPRAVADFNGDGKLDVLEQGTGTLLVLLGNGDGTFQAAVSTGSGASLANIVATDLNEDGKADVVGIFNNAIYVYVSNGDGTFKPGIPYALPTANYVSLLTADVNGDHKIDVVAISLLGPPGVIVTMLGNGDGTLQAYQSSTGVPGASQAIAGDFNGDGKLDLAIVGLTGQEIYFAPGNGDGTFLAPIPAISFPYYQSIVPNPTLATIDANGDGVLDLVLEINPVLQIYLGKGDGSFVLDQNYMLNNNWSSSPPLTGDYNRDGHIDIAAGNFVFISTGVGTFQGIPAYPLGNAVATGDFDKNGSPDVAMLQSGQIKILSNDGTGRLRLAHSYPVAAADSSAAAVGAVADLNGDGKLDLVFSLGQSSPGYVVMIGNGDGTFQAPAFVALNAVTSYTNIRFVVADFNHDGKPDLAFSVQSQQSIAVFLGNGDGTFGTPSYFFDGNNADILTADFNNDGIPDLASAGPSGLAVLIGNGDGTFKAAAFPAAASGAYYFAGAGDLNSDGDIDILASGTVYLGKGDGSFSPGQSNVAASGLADFNQDGKLDAADSTLSCCTVSLGNGDATFTSAAIVASFGGNPSGYQTTAFLPAVDMNGDGKPDLLVQMGSGFGRVPPVFFILLNTTPPPPIVGISPSNLDMGAQVVGSTAQKTVTVSNTGGSALTIAAITISGANAGDFSQSNTCGSTLAGGSSCTITITFKPTAGGIRNATLSITDNASGSPHTANVSGTGQDFSITPPTSTTTITAGQTASFVLTIGSTGGLAGPVSLTCTGAPTAGSCSVLPNSVTASGSPSTVTVSVTTMARTSAMLARPGLRPGRLEFALWFGGIPVIVLLGGTGATRQRRRARRLVLFALLIMMVGWAGCGGGNSSTRVENGTPAGTYQVTLNATYGSGSATLAHSVNLSVVVQ